ncbi:MAG: chemotaxis protein CheX [Kineosporiaceae bacterium]|nr:chemotaxis protein CheX [Kineosporiaceae bacterium]MBK8074420.1 chemotaxis protein CheX [Kineosporiaceae bacterium]
MSVTDEFEEHRQDLEDLLVEVLASLLGADEVSPGWDEAMDDTPVLASQLAIFDRSDESFTIVEIQAPLMVGRMIGSQLLGDPNPSPEDLLDMVAELGNILAGNVKSLVRHSCRLSLPTADAHERPRPSAGGVRVTAYVLGSTIELTVRPAGAGEPGPDVCWPGSNTYDELLETQP